MSSSDSRTKALFHVRTQTAKALEIAKEDANAFGYQLSKNDRIGRFLTIERIIKEIEEVLKYE